MPRPFKKLTALAMGSIPSIAERRSDLQPELVGIVDRMLARKPADRFAAPTDVADALEPFCAGHALLCALAKVASASR